MRNEFVMTHHCPICGGVAKLEHHLQNSPILQNVFFESKKEAMGCDKVEVAFYYCSECIFLFNPNFKDKNVNYCIGYNNDQLASNTYKNYIYETSKRLTSICNLNSNSNILEVGCGNAFFLKNIMKDSKSKKVKAYDPAYNDQYEMSDFVKKDYFVKDDDNYDLVIMRHCFDSFINNETLIADICDSLAEDSCFYIEATSLDNIMRTGDFTMLFHEYHSYYSFSAISKVLKKYGLIVEQAFPLLNGDYIGLVAKKYSHKKFNLNTLKTIITQYKSTVIWGISGRAVSLLSQLSLNTDLVQYGVDINEAKQGMYIPVTGQKIISPEDAIEFSPNLVIISNNFYAKEIMASFNNDTKFITFDGEFINNNEVLNE